MPALLIVESPAKAKTISKYLGKKYIVKASLGHIKDLPKSRLGVDENTFDATFNIIRGKTNVVKELRDSAKKITTIYLATDPDREGEAISYHIAQILQDNSKKIYRVLLHEITERSVKEALNNPSDINIHKVDAQYARRILDRLVGYKISPLLWEKIKSGLSAGRVQSVALRLICEREIEIKDFIKEEYWLIDAYLKGATLPVFPARLTKKNDKKITVRNKTEADEIIDSLKNNPFVVRSVNAQEKNRYAPPPFITSKLQQEAVRRLKMTVNRAMRTAQKLYEGIDLGSGERVGLITYMRTDSVRVSQEALAEARNFISSNFGQPFLPESPNYFKNKKTSQDAHEAIRPSSVMRTPDSVKAYLSREELMLYEMIWQRFVASQMKPFKYLETKVAITNGPYTLEAKGETPLFEGYLKVYKEDITDEQTNNSDEINNGAEEKNTRSTASGDPENSTNNKNVSVKTPESKLPPLTAGEQLALSDIKADQKFTQPPPRYTEATLVKELEEKEIGRPSTYATILNVLQDRNYVEKKEGKFYPSELGLMVVDKLIQNFHDLMDYGYTAHMETQLDEIEEGNKDKIELLKEFYAEFKQELESAHKNMANIKENGIPAPEITCSKCNQQAVIQKWGRYGKFYECTVKDCGARFSERSLSQTAPPEVTEEKCPKCGAAMIIRSGRFGQFLACQRFPDCKTTKKIVSESDKAFGNCPQCNSQLIEKRSKFGKFIACSNYPQCKFIKDQEVAKCPIEGCGGTIKRKRSKAGRFFFGCSNYPKCTYITWKKPDNTQNTASQNSEPNSS